MQEQTALGMSEATENKNIHWFHFSAFQNWYTKYVGKRKIKIKQKFWLYPNNINSYGCIHIQCQIQTLIRLI